jgi:hypothetical protein
MQCTPVTSSSGTSTKMRLQTPADACDDARTRRGGFPAFICSSSGGHIGDRLSSCTHCRDRNVQHKAQCSSSAHHNGYIQCSGVGHVRHHVHELSVHRRRRCYSPWQLHGIHRRRSETKSSRHPDFNTISTLCTLEGKQGLWALRNSASTAQNCPRGNIIHVYL